VVCGLWTVYTCDFIMKILVVTVNWLGDCVMTLPVFKALKEKFPEARVGVMAVPRVKDLFLNNPYIDEVITFDEKTVHRQLTAKLNFIRELRAAKYDTVYLIHRSFTRAVVCMAAGIGKRIGFKRKKTSWIITDPVTEPDRNIHRSDRYLFLLRKSGVPVKDSIPSLTVSDQSGIKAEKYLEPFKKKYRKLVAVNPAANWRQKRWPLTGFISLISELCGRGSAVFLIGTLKEKKIADQIIAAVPEGVYDLCGKTGLPELAALLKGMDCLISADSGPAHLGAALGLPVLVLFGPTDPAITGPRGRKVKIIQNSVPCKIPCYDLSCKDNICMQGISPEQVLAAMEEMIGHG